MKEQENKTITVEQGENWSNLPPELNAAVRRAHIQVAEGKHSPGPEAFARVKAAVEAISKIREQKLKL